ncbi:hypothetical protein G3A43_07355 [Paraburkholderia aspalathi]|nr:hypothetical protein [Paraburkholderia aspalathi]MBK3780070.1 hypothetical protein [Paraburkholderia aspalathi]
MADQLPVMEIDPTQFTRQRLMVTTRVPQGLPAADSEPWVVLEAEDGSGKAVAMCGPDTPASRADARRLAQLWNAALDREVALHS